ncbi:hypothetical protein ROU88_11870 [Macrococcus capreoli]
MTIIDPNGYQITLTESNISDEDFEKLMNSVVIDFVLLFQISFQTD